MGLEETNASEPLMTCRNVLNRRRNRDPDFYPASKGWAMPADCPTGVRHEGGVTSRQASVRNTGTCRPDAKGETQAVSRRKGPSTDAGHRGGGARSRVDGPVMGPDRRGVVIRLLSRSTTRKGMTAMDRAKPFCIAKRDVWEAYKQVKANRGAAGVDGQSIEDFDRDLSKNLYRIWNRMSSGSYFPPPVRRVDIPKGDTGGTRPLGIPTVSDRIAQMVVKRYLEPILEPVFHRDSYGYRPGKSAHDALAVARQPLLGARLGARPRHQELLR